jgi:uncharacterized protein
MLESGMPTRTDPIRLVLRVVLYILFYYVTARICGTVVMWIGGDAVYFAGITLTSLLAAWLTNWLVLRFFEQGRTVMALGLWLNSASARNLLWGLAGGAGSAALVLAPPLFVHAAHWVPVAEGTPTVASFFYVSVLLLAGAAGEELLFRGYGFQVLVSNLGPFSAIIPVGVVFALLHNANPHASQLGIANTAGFGILFGYAYWRTRDLWLPIGLHFGWNVALPLFGVNVSGLKIVLTGHEMVWTSGALWSGGEYGPEASLLTALVLPVLFVFLLKAPLGRQRSPFTDPPVEDAICEGQPSLPS